MRNLTAYEKETGWRYSIVCTNIPDGGISGVPGSHHPQYIDVLHREHACVETAGVRIAKAMGLRGLPSKTWQVNGGWVIAANIAADLAAGPASSATATTPNSGRQPRYAPLPGLAPPRQTRPPRPPEHPRHQPRLALDASLPRLLAPAHALPAPA